MIENMIDGRNGKKMTKIISIHSELSKILQIEDNTLTNCADIRTRTAAPTSEGKKNISLESSCFCNHIFLCYTACVISADIQLRRFEDDV